MHLEKNPTNMIMHKQWNIFKNPLICSMPPSLATTPSPQNKTKQNKKNICPNFFSALKRFFFAIIARMHCMR